MCPHAHDEQNKVQDASPRTAEPRRMLTETQVLDIVPVGRTTLFQMVKAGRFPKGTYISPNRRVWFADQITAWQNALDEHNPHYSPDRGRGRRSRPSIVKGPNMADVSPASPDTSYC
jgi:prophage regulatory protein